MIKKWVRSLLTWAPNSRLQKAENDDRPGNHSSTFGNYAGKKIKTSIFSKKLKRFGVFFSFPGNSTGLDYALLFLEAGLRKQVFLLLFLLLAFQSLHFLFSSISGRASSVERPQLWISPFTFHRCTSWSEGSKVARLSISTTATSSKARAQT